jgi:sugar/nucleoside kinase (ribokinase family)
MQIPNRADNTMTKWLKFFPEQLHYRALIGVGGIGSGSFFVLRGNETLGREESRAGRFLDRRDYCKLHIIAHYVAVLLGPDFATFPVGRVGDDPVGRQMLAEMAATGMDVRYVECSPGTQTLYSLCFLYPDGCGGNLTTDDSASSHVDTSDVARAIDEFRRFRNKGVALAAPEVPLEARDALLRTGTEHGFFRAASFTSAEISPILRNDLLAHVDLLAINREEAATAASLSTERTEVEEIVQKAVERFRQENPAICLSITAGKAGSWSWDGDKLRHVPTPSVPIESTAGAGDAHLAGTIVGIALGLALEEAQQLAVLLAAFSVTSPHTIHPETSRAALCQFALAQNLPLCKRVRKLLGD